jgi:phosphotransferase system HPr (HPr) family protein
MAKKICVTLLHDLHREQMAQFVVKANQFDSYILIERRNVRVNAKSPFIAMGLFAASKGERIIISAVGADAEQALEQLGLLLAAH